MELKQILDNQKNPELLAVIKQFAFYYETLPPSYSLACYKNDDHLRHCIEQFRHWLKAWTAKLESLLKLKVLKGRDQLNCEEKNLLEHTLSELTLVRKRRRRVNKCSAGVFPMTTVYNEYGYRNREMIFSAEIPVKKNVFSFISAQKFNFSFTPMKRLNSAYLMELPY